MPNYWNLQNGNELGTFCQQLVFYHDCDKFSEKNGIKNLSRTLKTWIHKVYKPKA